MLWEQKHLVFRFPMCNLRVGEANKCPFINCTEIRVIVFHGLQLISVCFKWKLYFRFRYACLGWLYRSQICIRRCKCNIHRWIAGIVSVPLEHTTLSSEGNISATTYEINLIWVCEQRVYINIKIGPLTIAAMFASAILNWQAITWKNTLSGRTVGKYAIRQRYHKTCLFAAWAVFYWSKLDMIHIESFPSDSS